MRKILLMSKVSQISPYLNRWVAHTVQKPQIKRTASSGITVKNPPLFDGSTSWFKHEELIDDWLDLAQLEAGKRGPALKNRLARDASMYKRLLDRKTLRDQKVESRISRIFLDTTSSNELCVFSSEDFFNLFAQREKT